MLPKWISLTVQLQFQPLLCLLSVCCMLNLCICHTVCISPFILCNCHVSCSVVEMQNKEQKDLCRNCALLVQVSSEQLITQKVPEPGWPGYDFCPVVLISSPLWRTFSLLNMSEVEWVTSVATFLVWLVLPY